MVHLIESRAKFDEATSKDKSNLIVIDCYATWCGPCKMIAPRIVKFSEEYADVDFYKLDVDELSDVAADLGVRAMPTFIFFKNGEKVAEVVGANPTAVKEAIEKHK